MEPFSLINDKDDESIRAAIFQEIPKLLTVFLGTGTVMLIGIGSTYIEKHGDISFTFVALSWGAIITANIYIFGNISGAHINPAITVGYAVALQFPWKKVPWYVGAEVLGSMCACWILSWIFDGEDSEVMLTLPVEPNHASDLKVAGFEFFTTFIYVLSNCGARADPRATKELGGVAAGATIFSCAMVSGKVTGASMNPARSIGPALITRNFSKLWVYVLSTMLGGIVASVLYFFHLMKKKDEQMNNKLIYADECMSRVGSADLSPAHMNSRIFQEKSSDSIRLA